MTVIAQDDHLTAGAWAACDHISVSDSYTVLMDDYLKENQSLREQLRQHDQENALVKVRRAFKKSGIFV